MKYRVWDENAQKFDKGFWVYQSGTPDHDSQRPNNIIIQLSTGIRDKRGVEIYEGDIIQHYAFDEGDTFVVEWNKRDGMWDGYGVFSEWPSSRIVGNIKENPELVKENR